MSKAQVIDDFIAFIHDLNDAEGNQLFHPAITDTIIRAIVNDKDFIITLDQLSDWLGCRVDNLKRYLKYYENLKDYKIHTETTGGRPKEVIFLTMNSVKKLALRARGKRADQIREYFIRIEEMFRENMEHSIEKRLKQEDPNVSRSKLKRDDRQYEFDIRPGPGIYAMKKEVKLTPSSPFSKSKFKVGLVSKNINTRYAQFRRKTVGDTELVMFEPTDHEKYMESCLHEVLDDYSEGHEIYDTDLETINKGVKICRENFNNLKITSQNAGIGRKIK